MISSDSDALPCRDLIERLIKLGFYYGELDRFAKKSRNLSWIRSVTSVHPLERADELSKQSREKKPSVYRRAIANGIGEILSVYRSAVLHIEQKLLAETTPILATVTEGLNKVHVLVQYQHIYHLMIEISICQMNLCLLIVQCHFLSSFSFFSRPCMR